MARCSEESKQIIAGLGDSDLGFPGLGFRGFHEHLLCVFGGLLIISYSLIYPQNPILAIISIV